MTFMLWVSAGSSVSNCSSGHSSEGSRISVGSPLTHKTAEYKEPVKTGDENVWTDQSPREGSLEEDVEWVRLEAMADPPWSGSPWEGGTEGMNGPGWVGFPRRRASGSEEEGAGPGGAPSFILLPEGWRSHTQSHLSPQLSLRGDPLLGSRFSCLCSGLPAPQAAAGL